MEKLAGLPAIRPHDLRHTHASLLLAIGEQPKTVWQLMGHSSVSTTADIYGHLDLAAKRMAVGRLGRILGAAGAS